VRGDDGDGEKGCGPATAHLQNDSKLVTLPDAAIPAEAGATKGHGRLPSALRGVPRRGGRFLGPEALPSFGATSLDHESSAARSHADEEAVGPSSAAIVRLERSLHCFWNPLRKVEPAMLSGIAPIVKTSRFWGVGR